MMKPKTKSILSKLSEEHSKAALINLWSDISALSREEFSAHLDDLKGKKPKPAKTGKPTKSAKKPGSKKSAGPIDDKPVTRIAYYLRYERGFSDDVAEARLLQSLVDNGVPSDRIPISTGQSLEDWLYALLGNVPDSKVLMIAKKIP